MEGFATRINRVFTLICDDGELVADVE